MLVDFFHERSRALSLPRALVCGNCMSENVCELRKESCELSKALVCGNCMPKNVCEPRKSQSKNYPSKNSQSFQNLNKLSIKKLSRNPSPKNSQDMLHQNTLRNSLLKHERNSPSKSSQETLHQKALRKLSPKNVQETLHHNTLRNYLLKHWRNSPSKAIKKLSIRKLSRDYPAINVQETLSQTYNQTRNLCAFFHLVSKSVGVRAAKACQQWVIFTRTGLNRLNVLMLSLNKNTYETQKEPQFCQTDYWQVNEIFVIKAADFMEKLLHLESKILNLW